jgi:hypothetical protein
MLFDDNCLTLVITDFCRLFNAFSIKSVMPQKVLLKKKSNSAADARGKTRIFIDTSLFIGFIGVNPRLKPFFPTFY